MRRAGGRARHSADQVTRGSSGRKDGWTLGGWSRVRGSGGAVGGHRGRGLLHGRELHTRHERNDGARGRDDRSHAGAARSAAAGVMVAGGARTIGVVRHRRVVHASRLWRRLRRLVREPMRGACVQHRDVALGEREAKSQQAGQQSAEPHASHARKLASVRRGNKGTLARCGAEPANRDTTPAGTDSIRSPPSSPARSPRWRQWSPVRPWTRCSEARRFRAR